MIKTTIDFIGIDGVSEKAEFAMVGKADRIIETALKGREQILIDDHVLVDHVVCAQFDSTSFRDEDKQVISLVITTEDDAGSIFITFDPVSEYLELAILEHNICIDVKKIGK